MSELLYVIAAELCDAVEDCLEDAGLDPPGRRFVDIGGVMAPVEFGDDCESQLSCFVGPLTPSRATSVDSRASSRGSCALLWQARFTIVMLRCHPLYGEARRGLPTPKEIDEQANLALRDGWQIARGMSRRWTQGLLVPSFGFDCENCNWGSVTALTPQGGIRGWTFVLDVTVNEPYIPIDAEPAVLEDESAARLTGRGRLVAIAAAAEETAILDEALDVLVDEGGDPILAEGGEAAAATEILDEALDSLLDESGDPIVAEGSGTEQPSEDSVLDQADDVLLDEAGEPFLDEG